MIHSTLIIFISIIAIKIYT